MSQQVIELPESVIQELDRRHISPHQVRAFVVQAVEAWLRVQAEAPTGEPPLTTSRFANNATPFAEKLVRENRELFERLAKL
ncbi:MAG: hypothetical protein HY868_20575 [Chloroflexi bacterium]|nr:hypothetical protein [Chloroflexota bacterium]